MRTVVRLALIVFYAVFARIGAAEPDLATRLDRYTIEYRLNDDLSHVESYLWEKTVLKERAIASAKEASVTYSTSIQKAVITEAYTRKADGRRIDVPKANFQETVNKGRGKDAPVFSDRTTLTVVFPEVAVGDTVVLAYEIIQSEPMFPGHFSTYRNFSRTYPYSDVRVRFDLPATLRVQYEAREMAEKVTEKDGRRIIEWTFANKNPVERKRRDYSVYDIESEPGFAISTFSNYGEIAEAYGARARPKAVVNERIQALADKITAGKTEPREQAQALYEWVATNITFAGNCIGVGAVVPHDTDFILDNRMGDCKDHATLLQALLAAKGIDSIQALVNAGAVYRLPAIPVAASVNHVINYLPAFDLYVDATAKTIPFGMLAFQVADKPVLWVDGYRESTRTPVAAVGDNRQHMKTVVRIAEDGSASGKVEVSQKGLFAVNTRAWVRDMPEDAKAELAKAWFQREGWIGSGTPELPGAKDLSDSYRYSFQFEIQDYVQRSGAAGFAISPLFYSDAPIMSYAREAVMPVEEVDVACSSGISTEEYVYEFPEGMQILSIPDDIALSNDFLSYRGSYKLEGSTLTVKRVLEDRTRGNVCSPETVRATREFSKQVLSNLRAQVIYKSNPPH